MRGNGISGKATVPGAGSGHGPGQAGWLGRTLFRVNKRQICSKAGSEQRSGRSDPSSGLCLSTLLRHGNKPGQGLGHFTRLSPTAPAETLQNGFPPAFPQHKVWQRIRHLLQIAANPLGSPLRSCCTGFQKKKGRKKKKKEKKLSGCSLATGGAQES